MEQTDNNDIYHIYAHFLRSFRLTLSLFRSHFILAMEGITPAPTSNSQIVLHHNLSNDDSLTVPNNIYNLYMEWFFSENRKCCNEKMVSQTCTEEESSIRFRNKVWSISLIAFIRFFILSASAADSSSSSFSPSSPLHRKVVAHWPSTHMQMNGNCWQCI